MDAAAMRLMFPAMRRFGNGRLFQQLGQIRKHPKPSAGFHEEMRMRIRGGCLVASCCASMLLAACGGNYGGGIEGGTDDGGAGSMEEHFANKVQPHLDFCRSCHVPGGIGDVENGREFQLSEDESQDLPNLRDSWERLGGNNPVSRILLMASGEETPHTGGAPWPVGSEAYSDVEILFECFDDSSCTLSGSDGAAD